MSSGATPGSETTFVDATVVPGTTYAYEIEAVTGDTVSDSVSTSAETKLPPLREARLQGWFNVRVRVIDQSGYEDFNSSRYKASLRFMPRCPKGACSVRWKMYREDAHGVLRRRGARYSGTFTGDFSVTCAGSPVTSTVTLTVRVVAARPINRRWRGPNRRPHRQRRRCAARVCERRGDLHATRPLHALGAVEVLRFTGEEMLVELPEEPDGLADLGGVDVAAALHPGGDVVPRSIPGEDLGVDALVGGSLDVALLERISAFDQHAPDQTVEPGRASAGESTTSGSRAAHSLSHSCRSRPGSHAP